MSTPVQSSLAGLKASTAQLVGIIASTQHIPAGTVDVHLALTKQVTTLLGDIIRAHEKGDYIPGIVASCSKELMRVRSRTPGCCPTGTALAMMTPRCRDTPGRHWVMTVNLPSPPVPPPAAVLPSPPIVAGNVTIAVGLEPEVGRSSKRKSPMSSGHSSQPSKSAMIIWACFADCRQSSGSRRVL
ncbi:hypothetical protein C8R48DRAFT_768833 [Suillus tomentosus]|nr:hypothetical protein C8R48DRAFT_768833 [Suillus tomentosus]